MPCLPGSGLHYGFGRWAYQTAEWVATQGANAGEEQPLGAVEHAAIGAPFTARINRALQPALKGWRLAPGVAPCATLVERVALSPRDASDTVS